MTIKNYSGSRLVTEWDDSLEVRKSLADDMNREIASQLRLNDGRNRVLSASVEYLPETGVMSWRLSIGEFEEAVRGWLPVKLPGVGGGE